jgi:membrane-bound lytic murein transglycosylase F
MNKIFVLVFQVLLLVLISCESSSPSRKSKEQSVHDADSVTHAMARLLEKGTIRAATDYSTVNYLVYRGETIGYQYELLKEFTKYLAVDLEMVIVKDLYKAYDLLDEGKVDIIAMGLTVTKERKQLVDFTEPFSTTRQVLVQRKPDNYREMKTMDEIESYLIRNQMELAGETVYVQNGTIFSQRLASLANEIGDTIYVMEEDKDVEELIAAVAKGEIRFTAADQHIALVNARYFPNIDVKTPISFPQKLAWAVRKGNTGLLDTINHWLVEFNSSLLSKLIYNKYFKNIRTARIARSDYNSFSGGMLSPYDKEIKKASKTLGWDWRLLASMIYQESEFKPNVRSWVGAYGLMQMMPATFEKYGIDTTASPAVQIKTGAKYLKFLDRQLPDEITDSNERIKFTLASYNCGLGHVLDARRLTEKYGKDPNTWTENVDFFIKNLSDKYYYHDTVVYYGYLRGEETYNFVEEILRRYEDYKNLIVK